MPPVLDASGLRTIRAKMADPEEQIGQLRKKGKTADTEGIHAGVIHTLGHIATNAWRAKVKMVDAETGEAKQEMQRVYRHIEAIFESLKGIGIETIDPTGRTYDSGMALKVVSFEQTLQNTFRNFLAWLSFGFVDHRNFPRTRRRITVKHAKNAQK